MNDTIQDIVVKPLIEFYENVLDFLPNLLASLFILTLGIVISFVLKKIFLKAFKAIGADKLSEKFGVHDLLRKWGINGPVSEQLSRIIGWLVVFSFLIVSLRTLNIPTVERLLEKFFLYLPNVFLAILILFIGYILSNFLARTVLIAAVNAGLKVSNLIGKFVKFTVFALAITMVLEQLGIGKDTVLIAFAIIFGGVVLAFAIAFGVGGRDAAKEYIEKRLKGDADKDDIQHL